MPRVFAALLCVALVQTAAFAAQDPLTPDQHLAEARQLISSLASAASSPAGQAIAALQRDFNDFASAYLSQAGGGTAAAAPPATGPTDWRSKYLLVESDVTALIGPANTQPQTGTLDAATVERLQQFRQHLAAIYATAASPQQPQAAAPTQSAPSGDAAANRSATGDVDHSAAIALLDRMQALIDAALSGKPLGDAAAPVGTSGASSSGGSKAGKVTIDRAALDEMRAEITQIRLMLGR